MKKREAFTLIELIAVLVILAILALIVTPLVLNIIRKARTAADKRSIDAYGRSIELAIADYLLDKGEFPTSIEELQVEYTGDEVVCNTTTLNEDVGVYLSGCTVGGRAVSGYTYGKEQTVTYETYSVGDKVTYNNVNYYVIKDSSASESTVTLLKSEPLTSEEIATYSAETGAQIYENNGYGRMQYGTNSNYATSYIKTTVDAWVADKAPLATEARLITLDELINIFGYELNNTGSVMTYKEPENISSWLRTQNVSYWTMSQYSDSTNFVWYVGDEAAYRGGVDEDMYVKLVIVLAKSVLN